MASGLLNGQDGTPTKLLPQQRKRKREHEGWVWGRLTVSHLESAFGVQTGLSLEGGQEGKKLLLIDLKNRIKDCRLTFVALTSAHLTRLQQKLTL